MHDEGSVATTLNAYSPAASNAAQLGFLERGHQARFAEACSALKLRQVSEPNTGYGTRSFGAKVIDQNGTVCWLKVFGLASHRNERWLSEMEADSIKQVPKPQLVRQFTWTHDAEFWVARLTTLVTGLVEEGPWAGASAHGIEDPWLESLTDSLRTLAHQPCTRAHVQTRLFARWLKRYVRVPPTITPADWVTSHNDLQWSNLSYPNLTILDWEWFGQSPLGYDQGMLIAYSCHDDELTERLEQAFKPALESGIGAYGKLFAAHTVRNSIRSGWLTPAMEAPLGRLISRWDSEPR